MEYTKEFLLNHIANLEKQLDLHKRQIVLLENRLRYANSEVDKINEDQLELDCE